MKWRLPWPIGRKRYPVLDPSCFDDPVAIQTGWTPLAPGGYRQTLHRLRPISPGVLSFRPTLQRHWQTLLQVAGLVAMIHALVVGLQGNDHATQQSWPMLVQIAVACSVSLYLTNRPVVIDGNVGEVRLGPQRLAWLGRVELLRGLVCRAIPFHEVYSIQLLDEEVHTRQSHYWSYELNLVLRNGQRIHLIDHGNQQEIRWDAGDLARMINVPIWDFIGYRLPDQEMDIAEIKSRILDQMR